MANLLKYPEHRRQARREIALQWARLRRLRGQARAWGWRETAAAIDGKLYSISYEWALWSGRI